MAAHEAKTNGSSPPPPPPPTRDPEFYAGFSRFEVELEFVQLLSSPLYLHHLAAQKYFDSPTFIAYLDYLQYFRQPAYIKFLQFPGPTLRALELLQEERFRREILRPDVVEWVRGDYGRRGGAVSGDD